MNRTIGLLMTLIALHASDAVAGQLVQFDAIAFEKTSATTLVGYLAKPDGAGPFPAVIVLHGCNGFSAAMPAIADRLRSWGYVALAIDSLGPRGRENACGGGIVIGAQPLDAYAGLSFLARQRFVDPERIGILGYSMGGISALTAVERGVIEQVFPRKFRAVVAYYPFCGANSVMPVPALVLIGALDDWTPAKACQELATRGGNGSVAIDLVVYPNAYHGFDLAMLRPGLRYFGHWVEYDEAAATDALMQTHRFLDAHLVAGERQ
jgi:dienelactone hydrolase